jgi:2-oxoglutarate dehydrogenase E1 component
MYVESLYGQWKTSPSSVGAEWTTYFEAMEAGKPQPLPAAGKALKKAAMDAKLALTGSAVTTSGVASTTKRGGIHNLIRSYQKRGHEMANLDPLGLHEWRSIFGTEQVDELEPSFHGFADADMDKPVNVALQGVSEGATLREVLDALKRAYCSSAGFQYTHINDFAKVDWIRSKVEDPGFIPTDKETLISHYTGLCKVDTFEKFLTTKYKTVKRFGIDGGEASVSGIDAAIGKAALMGVTDVVIGMPHRGRLNVLTNVVGKPLVQMFAEFKGTHYDFDKLMEQIDNQDWAFAGDVKYHLGTSNPRILPNGKKVNVTLECNPSHLETVNTVTLGRTRAKQYYAGNTKTQNSSIMPVLFHGDASFAGQGVVYETMQLAHVREFDVGGTIHVIVNNQVGFTTDPIDDRSTMYCSDLGKGFNIPIFHCNADDPIAVARVFELAAEWRQTFSTDVIVDVVCYRRYGHNETQNPDYTQPLLYKKIAKHPRAEEVLASKLVSSGVATKEELDAIRVGIWQNHEEEFALADDFKGETVEWVATKWDGFVKPTDLSKGDPTGVDTALLTKIGHSLCKAPEGFTLHRGLSRQLQAKLKTIEEGKGLDWATAEALAYGSLLLEGTHVRITGQDVQSGTFAHRHSVARDQNTMAEYCFLNNLNLGPQQQYVARNSILAEYAVLGFELGYSYENPNALCIWEAQFGDFANTAQVMIDQFICAGESKWYQQSGLVLLLPHGYEGQGAEHSSARIERFLQLSDDDEDDIPHFQQDYGMNQIQKENWQVMNLTTPANVFHALRRQVHRNFRKPMIVASTKSLFRHKECVSDLADLGPDSRFQRLIGERNPEIAANPDKVDRLIFCTGKIYYELAAKRDADGLKNVAIVSLEQIAPFPFDRVLEQLKMYKNVPLGDGVIPGNVIFCQEEPKNMGAWFYVKPRLVTTYREGLEKDVVIRYVGRRAAASPATGYPKLHMAEQNGVIEGAIHGDTLAQGKQRPTGLLGHQT